MSDCKADVRCGRGDAMTSRLRWWQRTLESGRNGPASESRTLASIPGASAKRWIACRTDETCEEQC